MKLSDVFNSILILGLFLGIYSYSLLQTQFNQIKKNWPKYRCNPTIMPFAEHFGHDAGRNFTYCIQTMQGNYMNYLLKPVHYIMSLLGHMIMNLINDINQIRKKIANFISNLLKVISSIFDVSFSILIEFQKLIAKIRSVLGKFIGIIVVLINILAGSFYTGQSIINGPIGDTLRFVKGL